jgi:hypothetical protein
MELDLIKRLEERVGSEKIITGSLLGGAAPGTKFQS